MEHMKDYPLEFIKPFLISLDLLSRSTVEIYKTDASFLKKYLVPFIFVPCAVTFHTSISVYMSKVFTGAIEFVELAYIVPVLVVATQGFLKAAIVVSKKPAIRSIIDQLGATWRVNNLNEAQIKKKDDQLKRLKICHLVFYWMNIIGSWQYMLVPLLETFVRRYILQQECELLFPFACSFPFDPTSSWSRYIAVYIFQIYSMIHIIYLYLGGEFLMITLCAHLSTEFSLLQDDLFHVRPLSRKNGTCDVIQVDERPDKSPDTGVKDIVIRHQKLIMISQQLDEIFNKMIFINLLFASVTICFFGFVAKVSRGPADMANNFVGVFASMLPIFNLCYYGEVLTRASAGIADSAYLNLWYKGDKQYQKMIYFIIKRSQTPCCLTSLKYAPITLNTFTTVLSTTWSYFSLATSLYEE